MTSSPATQSPSGVRTSAGASIDTGSEGQGTGTLTSSNLRKAIQRCVSDPTSNAVVDAYRYAASPNRRWAPLTDEGRHGQDVHGVQEHPPVLKIDVPLQVEVALGSRDGQDQGGRQGRPRGSWGGTGGAGG